ncbi:l-Fucosyltransferase [Trichonephila clavipes]|nr:l-Fucosyltransferase [Trichonephila clavipes]
MARKKKSASNTRKNIGLNTEKNAVFTAERYSVFAEEAIQFTNGAVHEEIGQQRNGTRYFSATNPDSISAVLTIAFECGDPVVNVSVRPLIYSSHSWCDGMGCHCLQYMVVPRIHPWHHEWHVHDILQPHVLPLMQRLSGAIFQQDNAQCHTAKVLECLRTVTTLL